MVDESIKGMRFGSFTYTIQEEKVHEFLLAIGEDNPEFQGEGALLPPTFVTTVLFWGGGGLEGALNRIGVNMWDVLHAEQEYTYGANIHVGDTVTGETKVADVYQRGGMNFVSFETEYSNQESELLLTDRALIIIRDGDTAS